MKSDNLVKLNISINLKFFSPKNFKISLSFEKDDCSGISNIIFLLLFWIFSFIRFLNLVVFPLPEGPSIIFKI